ncbi:MAG: hypothetical protein ABIJ34_01960 [archaeon]
MDYFDILISYCNTLGYEPIKLQKDDPHSYSRLFALAHRQSSRSSIAAQVYDEIGFFTDAHNMQVNEISFDQAHAIIDETFRFYVDCYNTTEVAYLNLSQLKHELYRGLREYDNVHHLRRNGDTHYNGKYRNSVSLIALKSGFGMGIHVAQNVLLTAHHVIEEGIEGGLAHYVDESFFPITRVIDYDANSDVALLEIEEKDGSIEIPTLYLGNYTNAYYIRLQGNDVLRTEGSKFATDEIIALSRRGFSGSPAFLDDLLIGLVIIGKNRVDHAMFERTVFVAANPILEICKKNGILLQTCSASI